MKRKIFYAFIALTLVIGLTGCGKEKKESSNIAIICTSEKDNSTGIEIQNESTYNFDENQNVTSYSVVTTQKFDDESLYKEYKTAQEETVKDSSDDVVYDLKSDDKEKTLVFTMTINNINVDDAETTEEKENLKASSILESVEESGYTCKVEGIDRSKLK